jgi:hypothetical protein
VPRTPYVTKAPPTAVPPVDLVGLEDALSRSPIAALAHQIAALTFHELMSLTTEITGREGYTPPATAYDLATALNDWAQAQIKTLPANRFKTHRTCVRCAAIFLSLLAMCRSV